MISAGFVRTSSALHRKDEWHLHVKVSALPGEGHMFQGGPSCLAGELPWDQVAVVLSNAYQHLHARKAGSGMLDNMLAFKIHEIGEKNVV